jgi:hypothetical protein
MREAILVAALNILHHCSIPLEKLWYASLHEVVANAKCNFFFSPIKLGYCSIIEK